MTWHAHGYAAAYEACDYCGSALCRDTRCGEGDAMGDGVELRNTSVSMSRYFDVMIDGKRVGWIAENATSVSGHMTDAYAAAYFGANVLVASGTTIAEVLDALVAAHRKG